MAAPRLGLQITLSALVAVFCLGFVLSAGKSDNIEKVADLKAFKKLLASRLNVLVAFTDRAKLPGDVYKVLVTVAEGARGIATIAHVSCRDEGAKLCKKRKVSPKSGQPLLQHYSSGEYKKDYDRSMNSKSMLRFLQDPSGDVPWDEVPEAKDVLHMETPKAFDKLVKQSSVPLLVMFYAPWCGHCKTMKPMYAAAASQVKETASLVSVDCTLRGMEPLQSRYNVTGFPTLLYFNNGRLKYKYGGENTREGIVAWLEDPGPPKEPVKEPEWSDEPSDVVHLTDDTFASFLAENPSVLVMFYAPWCGHCKSMKPDYTLAASLLKEDGISGALAAVDATQSREVAKNYEIKGFPSLKYFANGTLQFEVNQRSKDGIVKFMKDPKEEEPAPAAAEDGDWTSDTSLVVHLEDSTFKSFLKKKKHTLVMFYAPWCGHCKSAKPHFVAAAATFADNMKVAFAGVDCTVHQKACEAHEVKGYPTFYYFNYGKSAEKYLGGREEPDFVKFMNDPTAPPAPPAAKAPAKNEFEGHPGNEHVVQLKASAIQKFIEESSSTIILFYAPWCGHCKKMIPDYSAAARELSEDGFTGALAAIDVTAETLGEGFEIKGFPTMKYYKDGVYKQEFSDRSRAAIVAFIKDPEAVPKKPEPEDVWATVAGKENVEILTTETFDPFLQSNPSTLVMFYAPWCGHCQRLKVPYAEAATELVLKGSAGRLAAVDATQDRELSSRFNVKGFPTLLYFENGVQAMEYQGDRGTNELLEFMEARQAPVPSKDETKKTEL